MRAASAAPGQSITATLVLASGLQPYTVYGSTVAMLTSGWSHVVLQGIMVGVKQTEVREPTLIGVSHVDGHSS